MDKEKDLEVVTPESIGLPSSAVLRFIERLEKKQLCMHSFIMLRHGKIAAEGYYPPFHKDKFHRMYSISKTFVAVAVGLMADEGLISLDDKIADYFTEMLPENVHPYIAAMTIRDLLMMATPFDNDTYNQHDENWVWTFFNTPPTHPPGTIFSYNTAATVTLTALVEKLTGMNFLDYMRPRLLDVIGFSKDAWCIKRPEGGSWGGSGVLCTPRDLAKFALVLLNKGKWGDRQLVSEQYVTEAVSRQIDNSVNSKYPELCFGYGYQIWRTRNSGFALLGMGSQYAVCLPDKDFILVTTCDSQSFDTGYCDVLDSLWEEIYPFLNNETLPDNPVDYKKLTDKISKLEMPPVNGKLTSPVAEAVSGIKYRLNPNPMGISHVRFTFEGKAGRMEYKNATGEHCINFGFGSYIEGKFPEKHYYGEQIGKQSGSCYDCVASAAWADERTLIIHVYIVDIYCGTLKINVTFKENEISLLMMKVAEWFLDEYHGFAGGQEERDDK